MKKYIATPILVLFLITSLIAQDLKKVIVRKADYDNYPQFRYALALMADNPVVQEKISDLQTNKIQLLILLSPNKIEYKSTYVSGLTDYRAADKTITIRLDNSGKERSYMYFLEIMCHEFAHAFEPTASDERVHLDIAEGKGLYARIAKECQRSLSQFKEQTPASLVGFYEEIEGGKNNRIIIPENAYNQFTAVINRHIKLYTEKTGSKAIPQYLSYQKMGDSKNPDYNFSPIYFKSGEPPTLKYLYKNGSTQTIERIFFPYDREKGYDVFIEKANDYLKSFGDVTQVQFQKLFRIEQL
jgi:hypothetical protein